MRRLWEASLFSDKWFYTCSFGYLIYSLYLVLSTKQFIIEYSTKSFLITDLLSTFLANIFYVPILLVIILLFHHRAVFRYHKASIFIRQKSWQNIWLNECLGCAYITIIFLMLVISLTLITAVTVKPQLYNIESLLYILLKFLTILFLYIFCITFIFAFAKFITNNSLFAFLVSIIVWYLDFHTLSTPLFIGKLSYGMELSCFDIFNASLHIFLIVLIITILGLLYSVKKELLNETKD